MRFLLYPNTTNADAAALAACLTDQLRAAGQQICKKSDAQQANCVIVLGGDGTVLRATRELHGLAKPFWAVNCGHLGYLSDCGKEEAPQALQKLLQGDYRLEPRIRLSGRLLPDTPLSAMNEIIFHRGACTHALQVCVFVNDSLALRYRGDGLILATPSGSTAYNLSAGGSVLMPEMELLALTPICPQALSAAPLVVSARDTVRVQWQMPAYAGTDGQPFLTADGEEKHLLSLEGEAAFSAANERITLVRTQDACFYRRLQQRMNWNA